MQAILHSLCLCTILFNPDVGAISALCDSFEPFQARWLVLCCVSSPVVFCSVILTVVCVLDGSWKKHGSRMLTDAGGVVKSLVSNRLCTLACVICLLLSVERVVVIFIAISFWVLTT